MGAAKRLTKTVATNTLLAIVVACPTATRAADEIVGHVRNGTTGQPAASQEIVLLRLDGGASEEARTVVDNLGAFRFTAQSMGPHYLVRAIHQNVIYDQPAAPGQSISLELFDAADEVAGVSGSIEIIRIETQGEFLHVSDMYEIRNDSNPPVTLARDRTFDVFVPGEAKMDSVFAAAPGKVAELISATALPGEPGHYAVNFPLPPGATKFAFHYELPYAGREAFRTRRAYPVVQLAVMVPSSVRFSSRSRAFQRLQTGNPRYHVEAASPLAAGDGPTFEISGDGSLPPLDAETRAKAASRVESLALPNSAAIRQTSPSMLTDTRLPSTARFSDSLALEAIAAGLFAACAFLVWRARRRGHSRR